MRTAKNRGIGFEILGLDHVVLRITDMDLALVFYCEILGCRVERTIDDLGLVQLRAGRSLIDLVDVNAPLGKQGGQPPGHDGHNVDHICIRIDPFDPDKLIAHLESNGVTPGDIGRRYGADGYGQSMYIKDPNGNTVELKGPPEDAS